MAGLVRDRDGNLVWNGGKGYEDPGEAVKTWWAGEARFGCAERVMRGMWAAPCGKKAKNDPDARGNPTRCGVHCAKEKGRRAAEQDARFAASRKAFDEKMAVVSAEKALEAAMREIANGHNDPRSLAREVLSRLDAARAGAVGG